MTSEAQSSAVTSVSDQSAGTITGGSTPFVTLTVPTTSQTTTTQAPAPADGSQEIDEAPSSSVKAGSCQYGVKTTLLQKYTNRLTTVGGLYSATVGHTTRYQLSEGSDAQLGTGINMGSWRLGGQVSRSMSATTRWGALTGAGYKALAPRYSVGKYKVVAGDGVGNCVTYQELKPISHEGGAESYTVASVAADKWRFYQSGGGITLTKNKATTWSAGLDVSGIIGLHVSARSGYSTSEQLDVDITASAGRQICGTNVYPVEFPTRVVVKP